MPPDAPPSWAALIDGFIAHERGVAGLADETLRHRHLHLRTFAHWWDATHPDRSPTTAMPADLAAFLVTEADRGLSAYSRRAELVALRRFFAWQRLTGRVDHDPTEGLEAPSPTPRAIEVYAPADVVAILDHTSALRDVRGRIRHAIVATLRYTGMRSGELRSLRLDRLDLDARQARVIGKGGRPRTVVLPEPAVAVLDAVLTDIRPDLPASPLLLSNPAPQVTTPHRGFSHEAVYREVELAGQGARVPGRHFPHRWRHTFATELVRAGVDIHVVQRLLGHTTIHATVGYTHLVIDDLHRSLEGMW